MSQDLLYSTVEEGFTRSLLYLYSGGQGRMRPSPPLQYCRGELESLTSLLYSTVEESSSHSHPSTVQGSSNASEYQPSTPPLCYCRGGLQSHPTSTVEGREGWKQALLYSTLEEISTHSHPSTVEGKRDASEYLPSSPPLQ